MILSLLVRIVLLAGIATAGTAAAEEPIRIEETVIVGVTPLPGLGQPLDRVPANVQPLGEDDVEHLAPLDVTQLLRRRATGVHLTDTQNNPFQADVLYRGFTSSALLGTPQGISVFQDGARVNEFLGDTVNWDLIPQDAIASLQLAPGRRSGLWPQHPRQRHRHPDQARAHASGNSRRALGRELRSPPASGRGGRRPR